MLTSTPLQTATYLLPVCLFSISFLVFVNSSISFLVTQGPVGLDRGVGDVVGTLGFADELVALVACPVWGVLSDRVGVRTVCVLGYGIVGAALFLFVQARNVYPQLLLIRLFFSLGGAATSTMVTAILPSMTAAAPAKPPSPPQPPEDLEVPSSAAPSVSSELTITPARHARANAHIPSKPLSRITQSTSPSRLAGLVGVFTGCGALVALTVFLPLPARFSKLKGVSAAQALADSYYVVGAVALVMSTCCLLGLRNLNGEEGKGWKTLGGKSADASQSPDAKPPYRKLFWDAVVLGFTDADIGMSYLGGFVARASSVGISLFIPLFVHAYFIRSGLCSGDPTNHTEEMKRECRRAYVLAAELGGTTQLTALVFAPLVGYLSDRSRRHNLPLLLGGLIGALAYTAFGLLRSPEPGSARGGSPLVFVLAALLGISQICAIVSSLGMLGQAVVGSAQESLPPPSPLPNPDAETTPLIPSIDVPGRDLSPLKGSLSGIYSLSGGLGILLLTKLGGYLFDSTSPGAPFFMLAAFNGALLSAGVAVGVVRFLRRGAKTEVVS
ncbi:MAG: hypothetical protein M1832_001163 [Thelocarpon impressellum]|nr:MAG: hypothetical protein M1832_001163 [Thelocarpon impressellum]